jgi:hypothetical protein
MQVLPLHGYNSIRVDAVQNKLNFLRWYFAERAQFSVGYLNPDQFGSGSFWLDLETRKSYGDAASKTYCSGIGVVAKSA